MSSKQSECKMVVEKDNIYIEFDGKRIAERGHPGTKQAGTWVVMEPGFNVYQEGDDIIVEQVDARVH